MKIIGETLHGYIIETSTREEIDAVTGEELHRDYRTRMRAGTEIKVSDGWKRLTALNSTTNREAVERAAKLLDHSAETLRSLLQPIVIAAMDAEAPAYVAFIGTGPAHRGCTNMEGAAPPGGCAADWCTAHQQSVWACIAQRAAGAP